MIAAKRAAIAGLLDTSFTRGHQLRPRAPKAGDAWVIWAGMVREGVAATHTWRVLVWLPQDEQRANEWLSDHHDELWDVLESDAGGWVEGSEPTNLGPSDDQPVYGLAFNLRSE